VPPPSLCLARRGTGLAERHGLLAQRALPGDRPDRPRLTASA
jgi:hypothetical protein